MTTAIWGVALYAISGCERHTGNSEEGLCGNGQKDPGEECDRADFDGETCLSLGYYGGMLGCSPNCRYDTSDCLSATCGNGVAEGPEDCDGSDLRGMSCQSLSLGEGDLTCDADCRYNTEGCSLKMGDGYCDVQGGETAQNTPSDCGYQWISSGGRHSCGVRKDGSVWCWGINAYGQLGNGDIEDRLVPTRVPGIDDARRVSAGDGGMNGGNHTCAVLLNGSALCWGSNSYGQLGDGESYPVSETPVEVMGLVDIEDISAGASHTCAVTSGGDLYCWGANDFGQLGLGTIETKVVSPTLVESISGIRSVSISCGSYGSHTCAVSLDGRLFCWGSNRAYVLGIDESSYDVQPTPVEVTSQSGSCQSYVSVSAGFVHGCAVTSWDRVCCWGSNSHRQTTGTENPPGFQVTPAQVSYYSSEWKSVIVGSMFTCGILADNRLACFGLNNYGQLGLGYLSEEQGPTIVSALEEVSMFSSYGYASCAIKPEGTAWCWGINTYGQLGDGTTTDSATPIMVAY